jgi:hypothetical protein
VKELIALSPAARGILASFATLSMSSNFVISSPPYQK